MQVTYSKLLSTITCGMMARSRYSTWKLPYSMHPVMPATSMTCDKRLFAPLPSGEIKDHAITVYL